MPISCNTPRRREPKTWTVVGRDDSITRLQPLLTAHRAHGPVRVLGSTYAPSDLDDAAAVLIVGEARLSPRRALPGVFLRAGNGGRVPAGWLPDVPDRLDAYARAAAEVQLRRRKGAGRGPFVFLSELDDRAIAAVDLVARAMPASESVFRWTSERIRKRDLIAALQGGQGAAFYFGHGFSWGLAGYGGFDKSAAALIRGHPLGSLLCLTCSVGSRPRHGLSFCEEIVLSGVCAAAVGATGRTLHQNNRELGLAMAQAGRASEDATLAALLLSPLIPDGLLKHYRVVGDPLAQLIGQPGSVEKAQRVFAPAPDCVLPVIPFSTWSEDSPAGEAT